MLFNSVEFAVFLVIVYFLYWFPFRKSFRLQNVMLLSGSFLFYGWWDWRFVFLLLLSIVIDYSFGRWIHGTDNKKRRKWYLWLSVANNLAVLGIFKYYNFFADSFREMMEGIGFHVSPYMLSIILPVGVSFYTFHGMSYVFDIYNRKIEPVRNFTDYSLFVSFFPLLVAGPIERATHLLPQIIRSRTFNYAQSVGGLQLILWGLFKKIVVADTLAPLVDHIFAAHETTSSLSLILGVLMFAMQIYCDFSGYSDIARGTAKLFGFELLINFRFPYFSRDIAEFWRRWHISLSSWFKDYLYIPLGGSREGHFKAIRNTFIIFIVSGFWHGANWTFIFWGLLHALYFLPLLITRRNRRNTGHILPDSAFPSFRELLNMCLTFLLVCFAWIFFRAPSISDAFQYIGGIFTQPLLPGTEERALFAQNLHMPLVLIFMLIVEWRSRNADDVIPYFNGMKARYIRRSIYYLLICMILLLGSFEETAFIYFQF